MKPVSMMLFLGLMAPCGVAGALADPKDEKPTAEQVTFRSGDLTLHGWLWKPEGKGPFPALIWNHGSEKMAGNAASLAKVYTAKGYVLFAPHRHGHGLSPGDYIVDLQNRFRMEEKNPAVIGRKDVELHELYNRDVVAAVEWLKSQPYVDRNRLAVSGCSYGGIQTMLAAEQDIGVRAFVSFAPAAMSWKGNPQLGERLVKAVKQAKAPIFLLQAENDYNLAPSEVLGKALRDMGKGNKAKVYPAYGKTNQDGHGGFAMRGADVWGADVFAFLEENLKPR